MNRWDETPATFAKSLGAISYAEAEEFCRDVRRHRVLAMGAKTLQAIVAERLKLWGNGCGPPRTEKQRMAEFPLLPMATPAPDRRPAGPRCGSALRLPARASATTLTSLLPAGPMTRAGAASCRTPLRRVKLTPTGHRRGTVDDRHPDTAGAERAHEAHSRC